MSSDKDPSKPTHPADDASHAGQISERREGWFAKVYRKSIGDQPLPVKLFALFVILLVSVGSVMALLATFEVIDDGSGPPTYVGSVVGDMDVCPSAIFEASYDTEALRHRAPEMALEKWSFGASDYATHAGWQLEQLAVGLGVCQGPPTGGRSQVRAKGDLVEGFPPGDVIDQPGAVTVTLRANGTGPVLAAVTYIDKDISWCLVRHEVGHVMGIGLPDGERNTPSKAHEQGTGIMALTDCGTSWKWVQRDLFFNVTKEASAPLLSLDTDNDTDTDLQAP